ncbi:MAG TPA: hypothetical protein VF702_10315 [Allosphingosinicella sp.]
MSALAQWLGTQDGGGGRAAADAQDRAAAIESRYGLRIPGDFRRFLIEAPLAEELTDEAGTSWWPLARIRSLPEEYGHEIASPAIAAEAGAYLFFADYLCWCWAWAVCCSDGPNRRRVALIGGPDDFVAESFLEVAERYLRDPYGMANAVPRRREEQA